MNRATLILVCLVGWSETQVRADNSCGISKVACENSYLALQCHGDDVLNIKKANYGRTNSDECTSAWNKNTSCYTPNSLEIVRQSCQETQQCKVLAGDTIFGHPCDWTWKYLEVEYNCRPADRIKKVACEWNDLTLQCDQGRVLDIIEANFGRTSLFDCFVQANKNTSCYAANSLETVQSLCQNTQTCTIKTTTTTFGDPCPGTTKYLDVKYKCKPYHTWKKVACENYDLILKCEGDKALNILDANYGRTNAFECLNYVVKNTNCIGKNSLNIVTTLCQGTQSCTVKASNAVFTDPCPGPLKYLDVKYNCTMSDSIKKVACEGSDISLKCDGGQVLDILEASYGRSNRIECPSGYDKNTSCNAKNSLTVLHSVCQWSESCTIKAASGIFGDPCPGTHKYLDIKYKCTTANNMRGMVCENGNLNLQCGSGNVLDILDANYGRTDVNVCPTLDTKNTSCRTPCSLCIVRNLCQEKQNCSIRAANDLFGNPCSPTHKYLNVTYRCKKMTNPVTPIPEQTPKKLPAGYDVKTVYGRKAMNIDCSGGEFIHIIGAAYGRTEVVPSEEVIISPDCLHEESLELVINRCEGKRQCTLSLDESDWGEPCQKCARGIIYLNVNYTCDSYKLPDRTMPSSLPNESIHLICSDFPRSVMDVTDKLHNLESPTVLFVISNVKLTESTVKSFKKACNGMSSCNPIISEVGDEHQKTLTNVSVIFQCIKVPTRVRDLIAYKKGRDFVSLAWSPPNYIYGNLHSFRVSLIASNRSYDVKPTHCIPWPHLYCFTFDELAPGFSYVFEVSARNDKTSSFGPVTNITEDTVVGAPEAPVEPSVKWAMNTSIEITWGPPKEASGLITSFLVKINQINSYNPIFCCDNYFPIKEIKVTKELKEYSTKITDLPSGSKFAVSVAASTAWMGPVVQLEVVTRPPVPWDVPLPEVSLSNSSKHHLSWPIQSSKCSRTDYIRLIRCNLLLAVDVDTEPIQKGAAHQMSQGTVAEENTTRLLEIVGESLGGATFAVLAEYEKGEKIVLSQLRSEPPAAGKCGLTNNTTNFKLGKKYRIAAVQVLKYSGLYNVGVVLSEKFVYL